MRFVFYLWFILLILVGLTVTLGYVEEDYRAIFKSIFGSVNVCVFFYFPTTKYVLPTLYALWPVLVFQYCVFSIFRAWIALKENKISITPFALYTCTFVYTFCSSLFFATSFAVQPDLRRPQTIVLHAIPFTNLVIALTFLQIAITWFGFNVSWNGMRTPKAFQIGTFISVLCLVLTSIMKVTQHINAIGSLEQSSDNGLVKVRGVWWSVEDESLGQMLQAIDAIWVLCILVVPLIQSGYLSWRKFDTHGLIVTIGDNRTSSETLSLGDNAVPERGGMENHGYNEHNNYGGIQNQSNTGSAKSHSNIII